MSDLTGSDLALLAVLREALAEIDPVPPGVVEAAKGSFAWRTVDADLAELVNDTAVTPMAGIRGDAGPRLVTFQTPTLTVELEVSVHRSVRRLIGQLVPPVAADIEVRHSEGTVGVEADEIGRFAADGVLPGLISLVCRFRDARKPVVTSWMAI